MNAAVVVAIIVFGVLCLAVVGLVYEDRELADRARRRAYVLWQQRQAEQRLQKISHNAFDAMLREARQTPGESDGPWHD